MKMADKKNQGIASLKETTGGTRREDRQLAARFFFEPISIDAENVVTVIYMLRSPEGSVVLRAIASLERFGKKAAENLVLLLNSGIYEYIIPLVSHEDYLVRRFAQKLIAFLSSLDNFRKQILADDAAVNLFVTILEKEEDVVMHEFSALTLKELSSECSAAGRILEIEGCVDILYQRLSSPDPDVQKNCLDTVRNLLNDIDGIEYFTYSPRFDLKTMLDLTGSQYPVIQVAALQVIEQFMSWSMDNKTLSAFRDSSGLEVIIGIVETPEWSDLHSLALDILLKVIDNPNIFDYLQQSRCLQRLAALFEWSTEDFYLEKLLGIFARVSQAKGGRKALLAYNMGAKFGEYLQKNWSKVQEPACLGIANMAQYPPAVDSIMSTKPMTHLLGLVTDSSKSWDLREIASYAINILSHEDYTAAEQLIEENRFELLLPLLIGDRNIPMELVLNVLQIFIGITTNDKTRNFVINESVVKAIMNMIEDFNETYAKSGRAQVAAMECLSGFLIEEEARSLFQKLDGADKLIGCLKSKYASIRQWAAVMVTQMTQNLDFVKCFIRCRGLQWLLDRKEMRYSAPSWESAIEAVFRAYLPAKFALTGRLDLHDMTQDNFYVLRHQRKLFFILEDILEISASPAYPVYIANFSLCSDEPQDALSTTTSHSTLRTAVPGSGRKEGNALVSQKSVTGRGKFSAENTIADVPHFSEHTYLNVDNAIANFKCFESQPRDPYLQEYLTRLKAKFQKNYHFRDPQWLGIHPKLISERAKVLARFVADEMSGPDPDLICKDHYLEMHLNDVRHELETNLMPIGHIRMGSYLERAFLFKVLADKIGLPCALVRGSFGRAWVEIALPVISSTESEGDGQAEAVFPETPPPSMRSNMTSDEEYASEEEMKIEANCLTKDMEQSEFPPVDLSFANAFPTRLLKPNAIVDLVDEPGRIFPIGSYNADEYKGNFLYMNRKNREKSQ